MSLLVVILCCLRPNCLFSSLLISVFLSSEKDTLLLIVGSIADVWHCYCHPVITEFVNKPINCKWQSMKTESPSVSEDVVNLMGIVGPFLLCGINLSLLGRMLSSANFMWSWKNLCKKKTKLGFIRALSNLFNSTVNDLWPIFLDRKKRSQENCSTSISVKSQSMKTRSI